METIKVNRNFAFFPSLLKAIAYSETIEFDDKIYREFETVDAIYYFDTLFPELEEESSPEAEIEIVETQKIENKTFIKVKTNTGDFFWTEDRLSNIEE